MKKIWLGGFGSCSNHQEKDMVKILAINNGLEITEKVEDADLVIVTDTCLGTYHYFLSSLLNITDILISKKKNAEIIVSGCLAKGVKYNLSPLQQDIISRVKIVKSEDLVPYISKLLGNERNFDAIDIPHSLRGQSIELTPVSGCLNHCSFCKIHYMNFDLKSYPFEKIESLASYIEQMDLSRVSIQASNISLYGVDLYQKPRTHEIIKILTSSDKIKYAYVGAIINWYQELIDEIINNPKVKEIFVSIESGSANIYKLMNRPISLDDLIKAIKFIRSQRPDIIIQTEFIAGFPTETIDDLKRTIDLAYELDVYPTTIWPYMNSKQIPSSNLPGHSIAYCKEAAHYATERLAPLKDKYKRMYFETERYILEKDEEAKMYESMLINGMVEFLSFEQLDREYQVGEIVAPGIVKSRKLLKK